MYAEHEDATTTSDAGEVVRACQDYIAGFLGMPAERVDPTADFDRLGIDSSLAVALLGELEERYGVDLPPEALFENPTINAVAQLVEQQSKG
jgi:acyl carrier protein